MAERVEFVELARRGFTKIDAPYGITDDPRLVIYTALQDIEET
jgi:hypothetical protein